MRKTSILLGSVLVCGVANAQVLTDSFDYSSGTNLHNLAGTGGINWKNHNLNGNNGATVSTPGLSYADAGYSNFVQTGGAASVTSTNAGSPSWAPNFHPSLLYTTGMHSALGNIIYGSFLVNAASGVSIGSGISFDAGELIGNGNGAFLAGIYVQGNEYRALGYNQNTGVYDNVGSGKTTSIGQTDLIVFRYEQDAAAGKHYLSVAINPVFGSGGITWDATSTTVSGTADFRTEVGAGHYDPNAPGTVLYDEFRFGTTLDSVTPIQSVPEPASMAALGLGLFGLAAKRRAKTGR